MLRSTLTSVAIGLAAVAPLAAEPPAPAAGTVFSPHADGPKGPVPPVEPGVLFSPHDAAFLSGPPVKTFPPSPALGGPVFTPHGLPGPAPRPIAPESPAGRQFWGSVEYLFWYVDTVAVPPLIATLPEAAVGAPDGGSGTPIFPAGGSVDFSAQSGVRFRGGVRDGDYGFDIGAFVLETEAERGFARSGPDGRPALFRGYIQASSGVPQQLLSSIPDTYSGEVAAIATTEAWGIDANFRMDTYRVFSDGNDLLAGFRFMQFNESLLINDRSDFADGSVNTVLDAFRTSNNFYGGQVGLNSRFFSGSGWSVDLLGKLALGGVSQRAEIFGQNTFTGLPDEATGLYAGPNNAGVFERGEFAAVIEFGVKVGYCVTDRARIHIGYDALWLSSALRAGLAVDRVVNDSTVRFVADPPQDEVSNRPTFNFEQATDDVWFQGINFGLTLTY